MDTGYLHLGRQAARLEQAGAARLTPGSEVLYLLATVASHMNDLATYLQ